MRWQKMIVVTPMCVVASCSQVATIPSPFEPTETQMAEPQPVGTAAAPTWQQIGTSIRGKPIEAVTVGSGPRKVYVIGGFHGDEAEGPEVAAKLPLALVPEMISEAGEKTTIRIVRDMNPDGTALKSKGNTRGTDLNRNWPSSDFISDPKRGGKKPQSELETTTVLKDLAAFKPDVVIVFETAVTGRGPDVAVESGGMSLAYDFASAARTVDPRWRVAVETRYRTPGSVQSYVGRDMKKPVVTVQFRRGEDVQTNLKAVNTAIVELAKSEVAKAPAKATGKAKAAAKPKAGPLATKTPAGGVKPTPVNQTVTLHQTPKPAE